MIALESRGIKPGLDATRRLLRELASPHERLPVVLIGGTNGKGSTAAFLASIVVAGGYRVGLFTSPHLEEPRERIRLDGRAVELERLEELIDRVVDAGRRLDRIPTYFEAMTVASLIHFRESSVDLAVLEVGLGGRLDATNVTDPMLSIITSIARDHTEYLGEELAQIAVEKAGILRAGRPLVSGVAPGDAATAIRTAAERGSAELIEVQPPTYRLGYVAGGGSLTVRTPAAEYRLQPVLRGRHQAGNVRLAVVAAEELARRGLERLDRRAIAAGIRRCRWPARLERIELEEGRALLLDSAHNPAAVEELLAHLGETGPMFDLLFGALGDKLVDEMLEPLQRSARQTVVTRPEGERAWWPAAGVRERWEAEGVAFVEDRGAALDRALAASGAPLVVCGSIFLVGPIRRELRSRFPERVVAAAEIDTAGVADREL